MATENATAIHADNAARFMDNYAVMSKDGISFYGCEHNKQEAEALAKWIQNEKGRFTVVIHNTPDQIREARRIRGGNPVRYEWREEAFRDMGVWK